MVSFNLTMNIPNSSNGKWTLQIQNMCETGKNRLRHRISQSFNLNVFA